MALVAIASLVLLLLFSTSCTVDLGGSGPGPAVDITFVADPSQAAGPTLELSSFEMFDDGGIAVKLSGLDDVALVSYSLAWDPAIASFNEAIVSPLGGAYGESSLATELVGGQGELRVTHALDTGSGERLSGLVHVLDFDPCPHCAGETGVFVHEVSITDAAGRTLAANVGGGRLVVTRLR